MRIVELEMQTDEGHPEIRRSEEAAMYCTFDIFKVLPDGPVWVAAVEGLREARERMGGLLLTSPGEYFIHSHENGVVARESQEWAEVI
jgi:hypothetical protein